MSRTDKTRPWWVKIREKVEYTEARHDHRGGPCDLPADPDVRARGTRCLWIETGIARHTDEVSWRKSSGRTDTYEHRAERRGDRRAARREIRSAKT